MAARPRVLHRILVRPVEKAGRAPGWADVLATAVAVGVASGLLELGVVLAQVRLLHIVGWSTLMISRHASWMVPAAGASVVVSLAMVLIAPLLTAAARRVRRRPEDDLPGPAWDWAGTVLGTLLLLGPMMAVRGFHPVAPLVLAIGAGYRIRRLVVRPTPGWRRGVRGAAAIGIAALALLMIPRGASQALPTAKAGERRPNLLWIVVDTLRADRMSVYGYPRPTTPEVETWAKAGIAFEDARSTAPWTLPSHISMFTGLLPSEHGACVDTAYRGAAPTLAEHLRAEGYRTAGIVANVRMCNSAYGVGRGFDHYVDYPWRDEVSLKAALSNSSLGSLLEECGRRIRLPMPKVFPFDYHQPASLIAAKGRDWLATRKADDPTAADRPFFLFLNFMDVHGPYLPPAGAPRRFSSGPAPTKKTASPAQGWRAAQARDAADPAHRAELDREVDATGRRLGDYYDDCLAALDAELGRFLAGLRDAGELEDTWVVITGDHGEHFGEHGHFGHGSTLYNEQTHVPLILIPPIGGDRYAALRGRRIAAPVSLRDLPATVAELLSPASPSPFPGRGLARLWRSDGAEAPDPVLSEVDEPRLKGDDFRTDTVDRMESIIDDGHILIVYRERPAELFDLEADPRQQHNLAGRPEQAGRLQRMRKQLDEQHHRRSGGPAGP